MTFPAFVRERQALASHWLPSAQSRSPLQGHRIQLQVAGLDLHSQLRDHPIARTTKGPSQKMIDQTSREGHSALYGTKQRVQSGGKLAAPSAADRPDGRPLVHSPEPIGGWWRESGQLTGDRASYPTREGTDVTSAARDAIPHRRPHGAGGEPILKLLSWLQDRWTEQVRPHLSSERVSAACEVIMLAAWAWKFWS